MVPFVPGLRVCGRRKEACCLVLYDGDAYCCMMMMPYVLENMMIMPLVA